jgi:hypothetical protein
MNRGFVNHDSTLLGLPAFPHGVTTVEVGRESTAETSISAGISTSSARICSGSGPGEHFDPHSVACTTELRRRYFPDDESWTIAEESVLHREYLTSLGTFAVVYSWGVLHHTGQMWQALDNAGLPVKRGGKLFIAIYDDTGSQSARWK